MSDFSNSGSFTAPTNPYYRDFISRFSADTTISVLSIDDSAAVGTAANVAKILFHGSFGSPVERREVLHALEAAYHEDPSGVYELVTKVNETLKEVYAGFVVTVERDGDPDCFGGVLNLFSSAAKKFVDKLEFKLDFDSGKLIIF